MDDARLPGEMTLNDIAKRLETLQGDVRSGFLRVDDRLNGTNTRIDDLMARLEDVDSGSRMRDEQAHDLLKYGLEAREGLRESMEARFDLAERKQDEDISLLKDVLRHLGGARQNR